MHVANTHAVWGCKSLTKSFAFVLLGRGDVAIDAVIGGLHTAHGTHKSANKVQKITQTVLRNGTRSSPHVCVGEGCSVGYWAFSGCCAIDCIDTHSRVCTTCGALG